jgi:signal transduction histidine kinase
MSSKRLTRRARPPRESPQGTITAPPSSGVGRRVPHHGDVDVNSRLEREFEERQRLEIEMTELGEQEREALGQELHDGVCQHLSGVAMMADSLGDSCRRKSMAEEAVRLKEIAGLIRKASQHAGAVARSLHPVDVDASTLVSALRELAARQSIPGRLRCRLRCVHPVEVPDDQVAKHLFRIAQEATAIAIKHAHARTVSIALESPQRDLVLSVSDDGTSVPSHEQAYGLSLRMIRCHSHAIGATLTIESDAGSGTVLRCRLPAHH